MGTTAFTTSYLDDGGANWGSPEERHAVLEWHRASDAFTFTVDGQEIFANMPIEKTEALVRLFREAGVK